MIRAKDIAIQARSALDDVIVGVSAARTHLAIAGHGPYPDEPDELRHRDCRECQAVVELDKSLRRYRDASAS